VNCELTLGKAIFVMVGPDWENAAREQDFQEFLLK
jgi:hypothetical protein